MIPNILFYFFFNFNTIILKLKLLDYKNLKNMDYKCHLDLFMYKYYIIQETYKKVPLRHLDFQYHLLSKFCENTQN